MKITFLVSSFPSISERFISNQIIGLIEKGVEISILTLHKPRNTTHDNEIYHHGLLEKTFCAAIPRNYILRFLKSLYLILKWLIISPKKLRLALSSKLYNRAAVVGKNLFLLDYLNSPLDCDVLHCHFGPNGVVGSFLYDIGYVNKYIVTFHGSDINTYPNKHGKNVYKHLFNTAHRFTCNTSFTAQKVTSYGANESTIEILPVGLNVKEYPFLKMNPSNSTDKINLLTVARLTEKKGHKWTLEALAKVEEEYPNVTLHIVGSGPLKATLAQQVSALGLQNNVIFHGALMKHAIMPLYSNSDIFILSSVTASNGDMEGQGLVLQEAQAVGLPVISTLHNGIPDGVIEGKTGFLVPEKDAHALANRIKELISNPDLRKQMGQEGRRFVKRTYDIPVLTQQLIDIYHKIV